MKKQNKIPYNNKRQSHGLWIFYLSDGNLYYKGQYIKGIEHGYWIGNWVKPNITFYLK